MLRPHIHTYLVVAHRQHALALLALALLCLCIQLRQLGLLGGTNPRVKILLQYDFFQNNAYKVRAMLSKANL